MDLYNCLSHKFYIFSQPLRHFYYWVGGMCVLLLTVITLLMWHSSIASFAIGNANTIVAFFFTALYAWFTFRWIQNLTIINAHYEISPPVVSNTSNKVAIVANCENGLFATAMALKFCLGKGSFTIQYLMLSNNPISNNYGEIGDKFHLIKKLWEHQVIIIPFEVKEKVLDMHISEYPRISYFPPQE